MNEDLKNITESYFKVMYDNAFSNILIEKYSGGNRSFFSYSLLTSLRYCKFVEEFLDGSKILSFKKQKTLDKKIKSLIIVSIVLIFFSKKANYSIIDSAVEYAKKINIRFSGFVNAVLRNSERHENIDTNIRVFQKKIFLFSHIKKYYDKDTIKKVFDNFLSPKELLSGGYYKDFRTDNLGLKSEDGYFDLKLLTKIDDDFIFQDYSNYRLMRWFLKYYESSSEIDTLEVSSYPGGKSFFITGQNVVHNDIFLWKQKKLKKRLDSEACFTVSDAKNLPFKKDVFKFVFADLPCTATGIIKRRPEILYKIGKENLLESSKNQEKILNEISKLIVKDGYIFYSTCSIFREENEEQIKKFLKTHKNFILIDNVNFNSINKFEKNDSIFGAILQKKE